MNREAFEAWALRNTSLSSAHEMAWAAWQAALAQPQAEPVAWMRPRVGPDPIKWADGHIDFASAGRSPKERFITAGWTPLYASPAAPAPVVPAGWVMVPREPTEDQVLAGFASWNSNVTGVYAAMIAAAPAAPAVQPLTDEQINAIWSKDDLPEFRSRLSPWGMDRIRAIIAATNGITQGGKHG